MSIIMSTFMSIFSVRIHKDQSFAPFKNFVFRYFIIPVCLLLCSFHVFIQCSALLWTFSAPWLPSIYSFGFILLLLLTLNLYLCQSWAQQLEDKANESQPSNKAEKEKLKKVQSKARNTLRKLLRLSATLGNGSGEYGIVSEADVEVRRSTV